MNHLKTVLVENINNFCVVTLNRPEAKNAFDQQMILELTQVFIDLNNSNDFQGVILKGEGSAFCAGADLNWMKNMVQFSFDQNVQDSEKLWNMFQAIQQCKHLIITKVHGAVFGGALGLVACSDYIFSEEKTQFCFSEVKLGLAPAVISSFILNKCSESFIKPLMLSAEVFNTLKAQQIGLVQQIFISDLSIEEIQNKFIHNSPIAVRATKKLLADLKDQDQKKLTTELISHLRIGEDAQARLKKFFNKLK